MQRNDPRWLEHLDIITAWGEARALNRTSPPGWFDGPDDTRPMADRNAFGVGPHDYSWAVSAPAAATTDQLAELIVAVHAHADVQYRRYLAAVAAARAAIWAAFTAAFPDASTDDLPAEFDKAMVAELAMLLTRWLAYHRPPDQLDDVLGATGASTCGSGPS